MTTIVRRRVDLTRLTQAWLREQWLQHILIGLVVLWLLIGVVLPLGPLVSRSLSDANGQFAGAANFVRYFRTPGLAWSFGNSLWIAGVSTVLAVMLAFGYAYALTRTAMPGKSFFRAVAMLPLYAPTMALGIGLVYLFGNKGLATTGFLGLGESLFGRPMGWNIDLYGPIGIILGELLYCFPQALVILVVAAGLADAQLYEASHALRATPLRTFWTVTLPTLLCVSAILEIVIYYFVNAMVTVSAVIFLYSPSLRLAAVAIVNMEDAGDTAAAAAMSALVILTSVGVRLLYEVVARQLNKRTQRWRVRETRGREDVQYEPSVVPRIYSIASDNAYRQTTVHPRPADHQPDGQAGHVARSGIA